MAERAASAVPHQRTPHNRLRNANAETQVATPHAPKIRRGKMLPFMASAGIPREAPLSRTNAPHTQSKVDAMEFSLFISFSKKPNVEFSRAEGVGWNALLDAFGIRSFRVDPMTEDFPVVA